MSNVIVGAVWSGVSPRASISPAPLCTMLGLIWSQPVVVSPELLKVTLLARL